MTTKKEPSSEAQKFLKDFQRVHGSQERRVGKMESIVNTLDTERIIGLNDQLRDFYTEHKNPEILSLLDRMTVIMNQITEIIHQVKAKRMSLSVAEKEIQERVSEIDEVVDMMRMWESASL